MSPSRSKTTRQPRVATRIDEPTRGRYYDIEGERYPSVTTILGCLAKPALVAWAAREERAQWIAAASEVYTEMLARPEGPLSRAGYVARLLARVGQTRAHARVSARARALGTAVHRLVEWDAHRRAQHRVGPRPDCPPEAVAALAAWDAWADRVQLRPRIIEQVVYSRMHVYAGTVDLVADVEGQPAILDIKTGAAIYPEAELQVVAYARALAEMGHDSMPAMHVVRVPVQTRDPVCEVHTVTDADRIWSVFLAIRHVWSWWEVTHGRVPHRTSVPLAR